MGLYHSPSIVRDGLVLCLDAANPKSYPGSGTTWYDLSGNGINGTLQNGVTFLIQNNRVFSFDGSDDTVWFTNSTLLDNQNQTVLVWAKTNNTTQNGFWFEKGSVNSQYSLFQEGSSIVWRHKFTDATLNSQYTTTATYLNITNYFMVAGTYNSVQKITYINGTARTTTNETRTVSTNATGMRVGSYVSGSYFYNGNIAQVQVYNRALSAAEIAQNFAAHRGRYGI